jgi:hypothetical protein
MEHIHVHRNISSIGKDLFYGNSVANDFVYLRFIHQLLFISTHYLGGHSHLYMSLEIFQLFLNLEANSFLNTWLMLRYDITIKNHVLLRDFSKLVDS